MTRVPPTATDPARQEYAQMRQSVLAHACEPKGNQPLDRDRLAQCVKNFGSCLDRAIPFSEYTNVYNYCGITQPQQMQTCLAQQVARLLPTFDACVAEQSPRPARPEHRRPRNRLEPFFGGTASGIGGQKHSESREDYMRRLEATKWVLENFNETNLLVILLQNPDCTPAGLLAGDANAARVDLLLRRNIAQIFINLLRKYFDNFGHFENEEAASDTVETAIAFAGDAIATELVPGASLYKMFQAAWDPVYLPMIAKHLVACTQLRQAIADLQKILTTTKDAGLQTQIRQDIADRTARLASLGNLPDTYPEFFAARMQAMLDHFRAQAKRIMFIYPAPVW